MYYNPYQWYPYNTVGQDPGAPPVGSGDQQITSTTVFDFLKRNWIPIGISFFVALFIYSLVKGKVKGRRTMISYPPPSKWAKLNEKDMQLALYNLHGDPRKFKLITKDITPKDLLRDADARVILNEEGYIQGYPYYEARHVDGLTPGHADWYNSVKYWYDNYYAQGKKVPDGVSPSEFAAKGRTPEDEWAVPAQPMSRPYPGGRRR